MSSYVTRTTRTVRTFGGPDGATTETHTYSSDGKCKNDESDDIHTYF